MTTKTPPPPPLNPGQAMRLAIEVIRKAQESARVATRAPPKC